MTLMKVGNEIRTFTATDPQPIFDFLQHQDPHLAWEEEFNQGKVRVGKYFVGRHYRLSPGDQVTHDPQLEIPEPQVNFDYTILYEDAYLAVLDKPVPLPIHPTGSYFHHTLTRILQKQGRPWHTVHRLDNETSGVLLLAKHAEYTEKLRQSLILGKKFYLVMVYGHPPPRMTVDLPLGKKSGSRVFKRQGYHPQGKESCTHFRRVGYRRGKDGIIRGLLMAQPLSGRTHQIRAHLAESDFPVVGDKIYGKDERYFLRYLKTMDGMGEDMKLIQDLELNRQWLHCHSITIPHPFIGKTMRFKADLPDVLKNYWETKF